MSNFLHVIGIRKSTAAFAVVAALTLAFGAGVAMADDIGGEDIVVPPPAPAPAAAPAPPPVEEDRFKLYLTGIVGYSWAKGEAGGQNQCLLCLSSSKNRGDDWDNTVFGAGALGFDADLGPVGLRVEMEGQGGRNYDFNTDGPTFTGAIVPPLDGNYDIAISNWAMFWNVFLDIPITDAFDLYLGGGVGFGVSEFRVKQSPTGYRDTSNDDLNFAWQVGTGMAYDVAEWLTLDLGYRYVDFGQLDVNLAFPLRGDYEMDLTSHDLILGVRINYYAF
jgi:opacity protein-like surface antigen